MNNAVAFSYGSVKGKEQLLTSHTLESKYHQLCAGHMDFGMRCTGFTDMGTTQNTHQQSKDRMRTPRLTHWMVGVSTATIG